MFLFTAFIAGCFIALVAILAVGKCEWEQWEEDE